MASIRRRRWITRAGQIRIARMVDFVDVDGAIDVIELLTHSAEAHNLKVVGSNPIPATTLSFDYNDKSRSVTLGYAKI
jgi:hypothetical protein